MEGTTVRASARWLLAFAVLACLLSSAAMSASMPMAMAGGNVTAMAAGPAPRHAGMDLGPLDEPRNGIAAVTESAPPMGMACGLKHGLLPAGVQVGLHVAPAEVAAPPVSAGCGHVRPASAAGRSPPDLHALTVSRT